MENSPVIDQSLPTVLSPLDNPDRSVRPKRGLVHVRELDGVRGIAALAVFFHHVCYATAPPEGWGLGIRTIHFLAQFGFAGVDLFFVLSGFLITSLLIEDRESKQFYSRFYWKRVLRILPLYIACLIGLLIFVPHSGRFVIFCVFFLANFATLVNVQNLGPFWSLAIEEQFYLVWPTVVRSRSIDQIRRWALVIGLGAVLLRLIAASFGHYNLHITFLRCDVLAFGAWLACRFEKTSRFNFTSQTEKLTLFLLFPIAVAIIPAVSFVPPTLMSEAYGVAIMQTAITFVAGTLILFILANHGKPFLGVLRSPILTFFGLISYAFYMVHGYVISFFDKRVGLLHPGDLTAYWVRLGAILLISTAVSLVSRYVIELPASSLRKYVLPRA